MKIKHLLLAICILISAAAQAQSQSTPQGQNERPKVGLVLSGGGAKGAAHIGILKYLEEIGLPVDYVAGTSMGSIIGGLYSLGYTPYELDTLISQLDWSIYMSNSISRERMSSTDKQARRTYMVTFPFNLRDFKAGNGDESHSFYSSLPSSFIDGSKLINLFSGLCVGYQDSIDFNDLPIPFACVATNIRDGKEVVLSSGRMPIAMRASMAIPGVFEPVRINGMHLVDGGVVNNVPSDVCKAMGADIVIGIEVADEVVVGDEQLQSLPQLALQLVNITGEEKNQKNRELCDIYIHPNIKGYNTLSFDKTSIDTLIQRGYQAAKENSDKLLALKAQLDAYGKPEARNDVPRARAIKNEQFVLNSVSFNEIGKIEQSWLMRKCKLQEGKVVKGEDIEKAIETIKGTGSYSSVTYTVKETENRYGNDSLRAFDLNMRLKMTEPHMAGFGFRYDTEESASVLLNVSLNRNRLSGFKFDLTSKLGYNPYIRTTFTLARNMATNFNFGYEFRSTDFRVYGNENQLNNIRYIGNAFSLYISEFHLFSFDGALGCRLNVFSDIQSTYNELFVDDLNYGPFLRMDFDNMDNAMFAKHGTKVTLNAKMAFGKTAGQHFGNINVAWSSYFTPNEWRLTFIPQIYLNEIIGNNDLIINRNFVGGCIQSRYLEQQLPFIGTLYTHLTGNYNAIARFDARLRIFKKHYLTAMVNYLHHSEHIVDFFRKDASHSNWGCGLRYTIDTPIGPISLDGQWSDFNNKFSAHFSLGYTF